MDSNLPPVILNLINIPYNQVCQDCGGSPIVYVSIQNSVFLCQKCGVNHCRLSKKITTIKTLSSLLPEDILILSIGGNARFSSLMAEYNVASLSTKNPDFKYILKISEYYRNLLKAEVKRNENPQEYNELLKQKPSLEEGVKLMDGLMPDDLYCTSDFSKKCDEISEKVGNFFTNVGNFISKKMDESGITQKLTEARQFVGEKWDNFNEKHPEIGKAKEKASEYANNTKEFLSKQADKVKNNEKVQKALSKTEEQYNKIRAKATQAIVDERNK